MTEQEREELKNWVVDWFKLIPHSNNPMVKIYIDGLVQSKFNVAIEMLYDYGVYMKKRKIETIDWVVKVIVEKTDTGFSAYCKDIPVYTTGTNSEELETNLLQAIQFYIRELPHNIKLDIYWKQ